MGKGVKVQSLVTLLSNTASEQLKFIHQLSSWAFSNFTALVLPIPLCFHARLWGFVWLCFFEWVKLEREESLQVLYCKTQHVRAFKRYKRRGRHFPAVTYS